MQFQGVGKLKDNEWQPLLSGCNEGDMLLLQLDDKQQLVETVDFYKVTKIYSSMSQSKLDQSQSGWIPKNAWICFLNIVVHVICRTLIGSLSLILSSRQSRMCILCYLAKMLR